MTGKDILKITINLVVIYVIGGLLLAGVYALTSPVIFKKNKEEKAEALRKMMPEADRPPDKLGDWEPQHKHAEYYSVSKGGETIGYIAETYGKGYSSYINILVSVDKDLTVQKINILHHAETPGLGDEIERDYFKNQFIGKKLEQLEVVKTEGTDKVLAISGATISSRAVTLGIKDAVTMLKDKLSGQGGGEGDKKAEEHTGEVVK
jgi:electron transport complex protein RnfG